MDSKYGLLLTFQWSPTVKAKNSKEIKQHVTFFKATRRKKGTDACYFCLIGSALFNIGFFWLEAKCEQSFISVDLPVTDSGQHACINSFTSDFILKTKLNWISKILHPFSIFFLWYTSIKTYLRKILCMWIHNNKLI